MMRRARVLLLLPGLAWCGAAGGADWPMFRGPAGDGRIPRIEHPTEWSDESNVAWKAAIEGSGWSAPVVAGDRVFVTSAVAEAQPRPKGMGAGTRDMRSFGLGAKPPQQSLDYKLHCLDLKTGMILWSKTVVSGEPKIAIHPSNTYATESPAADQRRVVVFFGVMGTLACFDHTGKQLWSREFDVKKISADFGTGSSPLLDQGRVYLQQFNEEDSVLGAYDAESGAELWSKKIKCGSSWATPLLWRNRVRTELVACGGGMVISVDPTTGDELWRMTGIASSFSASPTASEDLLYFANGGPFSLNILYAVKAGATGDITIANDKESSEYVAWRLVKPGVGMASPVLCDGRMYIPQEGKLSVLDAKTGERIYRSRLPNGKAIVSCPWASDDKVLMLDEDGNTFVLRSGETFDLLGVNKVDGLFWSTPAIAGERLLLRSADHLYCIQASIQPTD